MKLILRSPDGRFFEVDESVVKEYEVKPEDLPAGALGRQSQPPGAPNGGPGGGGGPQVVIYTMSGGGVGGPPPQQAPPPGSEVTAHGADDKGDVEARQWANMWQNWNNWNNWPNWYNWGNWGNWGNAY